MESQDVIGNICIELADKLKNVVNTYTIVSGICIIVFAFVYTVYWGRVDK